jgi:drug/metabolite transporter (DMT)-like permease
MCERHSPPAWQIISILSLGILAISSSAILVRLATATAQNQSLGFSFVIAGSRLTIAALLLSPGWRSFQFPPFAALRYSIAAGFCLAIHFATWIASLAYTSITASTTLVTTNPIWVALISWLVWQESLSRPMILGMTIALSGGLIISHTGASIDAPNPLLGNCLALVGAIAMSLSLLSSRAAQRSGITIGNHVLITYSLAAIVLLPLPWFVGTSYQGYPAMTYVWFAAMALIPQLIGHTSLNWAVKHISPTLVALTILAEPIGASLLAYLLLHEIPSQQTLMGAGLLLLGVAIASFKPQS